MQHVQFSCLTFILILKTKTNVISFQLIDQVCTTLFDFYRSPEEDLHRFTLFFLPTLIYVYLNAVAHSESKVSSGIDFEINLKGVEISNGIVNNKY